MDNWKKFNETSLPEKRRFLQPLKYGRYYWYRLRVRKRSIGKDFEIKNLGEYNDLYVQSNT